jgi:hypothetical protein
MQFAKHRVALLLEEAEHERLASQARAASAARRQRRHLTLTARAQPWQRVHEHAGAG